MKPFRSFFDFTIPFIYNANILNMGVNELNKSQTTKVLKTFVV